MNKTIILFCSAITLFIIVFTIVYTVRCTCRKEGFDPVDSTKGYDSGVKVPDVAASNLSILSGFNVKTPMKMYNGETNTLTLNNTTGDITGNIANTQEVSTKKITLADFNILDIMYPVGCVYISYENKNLKDLYGFGEWEQIKDVFLWAGDDSTKKGGSKIISEKQMPKHKHGATTTIGTGGAHTHNYNNNAADDSTTRTCCQRHNVAASWESTQTTTKNGDHNHTATTTITETGGGEEYMPPYQTVFMWKRLPDPIQPEIQATDGTSTGTDASASTPPGDQVPGTAGETADGAGTDAASGSSTPPATA